MAYYNGKVLLDIQKRLLDKYNIYADIEELNEITTRLMKAGLKDLVDFIQLDDDTLELVGHNLKMVV